MKKMNFVGGYIGMMDSAFASTTLMLYFDHNTDSLSINFNGLDTLVGLYIGSIETCQDLQITFSNNNVEGRLEPVQDEMASIGSFIGRVYHSPHFGIKMTNNVVNLLENS